MTTYFFIVVHEGSRQERDDARRYERFEDTVDRVRALRKEGKRISVNRVIDDGRKQQIDHRLGPDEPIPE